MIYLVEAMCVEVGEKTIRVRSLVLRHEQEIPLNLQGVFVKTDETEHAEYTDISKLKEPPHVEDRLLLVYGDDRLEAKTLIGWVRVTKVILSGEVIKIMRREFEGKEK